MTAILRTNHLTKRYNNRAVVNDLSMTIHEGDIYGFIGKNGAGKTTLIRMITGLASPSDGNILLFGSPELKEGRSAIGTVIESPALYPGMTARQNLIVQCKLQGIRDESQADAILTLVGLDDTGHKKAKDFSLGMRQRLGIALALLPRPRLVILDEPTNGLDIEGVVHIRSVIKEMSEKNKTTFLISGHVASELEKLCDKVAVIYDGRLLAMNSMEEVLENFPSLEDYFLSIVGNAKDTERRRVI